MSLHPYQILECPILTEKATNGQGDAHPKYTFKVPIAVNKAEIKKAVERAFEGVRVEKVNTVTCKGKKKRLRTAKFGYRPTTKKAIITLAEGDSINLI